MNPIKTKSKNTLTKEIKTIVQKNYLSRVLSSNNFNNNSTPFMAKSQSMPISSRNSDGDRMEKRRSSIRIDDHNDNLNS